jgi:hypothetical protein
VKTNGQTQRTISPHQPESSQNRPDMIHHRKIDFLHRH